MHPPTSSMEGPSPAADEAARPLRDESAAAGPPPNDGPAGAEENWEPVFFERATGNVTYDLPIGATVSTIQGATCDSQFISCVYNAAMQRVLWSQPEAPPHGASLAPPPPTPTRPRRPPPPPSPPQLSFVGLEKQMRDISSQVDQLRIQMHGRSHRRSGVMVGARDEDGGGGNALGGAAGSSGGEGGGDAAPPSPMPAPSVQDNDVLEKLQQLEALLQTEGTAESEWVEILTADDYKTIKSLAVHFSSNDFRVRNAANRILLLAAAKGPTILPHCLMCAWGRQFVSTIMTKGWEAVREPRGRGEQEVLLPWLVLLFEVLIACVQADLQMDWVSMHVLNDLGGELFILVGDEPRENGEDGDVHVVSAMCLAGLIVSYDAGNPGPDPPAPRRPPPLIPHLSYGVTWLLDVRVPTHCS